MNFRVLRAAMAASMLSLMLVEVAQAQTTYPITSRSGTSTVTGVYRPLDLNLQLGSGSFFYDPAITSNNQTFALTGNLTGTYSSTYGASGDAGSWTLNLGFNIFNGINSIRTGTSGSYIYTPILAPILNSNITDSDDGDKNINLRITGNDRPVGSLVYNSGLMVTGGVLPAQDTPNTGDLFLLYAKNSGNVFEVAVDNLWSPSNFYLALAQNLFHLGPYVSVGENIYALDDGTVTGATRVNEDCDSGKKVCGSVPSNQFFASSVVGDTVRNVPEPASLILVGLGLVGIALVRRRQQPG